MADDLATLDRQLAELREARASGAVRVRFKNGDFEQEVQFRTDADLRAAIADIEQRIAARRGGGGRIIRISTSKGL